MLHLTQPIFPISSCNRVHKIRMIIFPIFFQISAWYKIFNSISGFLSPKAPFKFYIDCWRNEDCIWGEVRRHRVVAIPQLIRGDSSTIRINIVQEVVFKVFLNAWCAFVTVLSIIFKVLLTILGFYDFLKDWYKWALHYIYTMRL